MACCFGGGGGARKRRAASAPPPPAPPPAPGAAMLPRTVVLPGCDPVRLLGEGTFGTVVLVRERSTAALFATKIMSKDQLVAEGQLENVITERRVLREAGPHPFVIECHSGFQTREAVVLVLEYLSGGDMFDLLKKNGCLSEEQARFYVAEILIGLQELHRLNFVFRDLKLENILLDSAGHVRLTDFGLSGKVVSGTWDDRTITDISGTAIYQAPEILAGNGHGRTVDFWALGVLTHVILTGRPPFPAGTSPDARAELYRQIQGADVDLDGDERLADVSPAARDFIRQMLQRDPAARLGASDGADSQASLRAHPFFAGVDWDALLHFRVPPPLPPPLSPPPGLFLDAGEGEDGGTTSGGTGSGSAADATGAAGAAGASGQFSATDAAERKLSAAAAEKHVFDKLRGSVGSGAGGGSRKMGGKSRRGKPDKTEGLDAVEYKMVDVSKSVTEGRVSIGLDFRGVNKHAGTKTWTGTTDDFGRFIAPAAASESDAPGVTAVSVARLDPVDTIVAAE